jgi:formyltetrahydrofolate hydrolase
MLGDDIEKNRVEYVGRVELDNIRLQRERDEFEALVRRHQFKITFRQEFNEVGNGCELRAICEYNGKVKTVAVSAEKVFQFKDDRGALLRYIVDHCVRDLICPDTVEDVSANFEIVCSNIVNLKTRGVI